MSLSDRQYRAACAAIIVVLSAWIVARAAIQSLTHDEALTYETNVTRSWFGVLRDYNTNHHVLHTIAAKLSVTLLGPSKFTLRLPAVLAGIAYVALSARLATLLCGRSWLALLMVALLTLHPYLFDFLSIARGYGLALAFALLHFDALLRGIWRAGEGARAPSGLPPTAYPIAASLAAGAAVCANLTFLFPMVATSLVFLALRPRKEWLGTTVRLALPAAVVCTAILGPLLVRARGSDFSFGQTSLAAAGRALIAVSFERWWIVGAAALIGALLAVLPRLPQRDPATLLFACALPLAAILLVIAHGVAGMPYPAPRMALYAVPMVTLLIATGERRLIIGPAAVILVLYLLNAQLLDTKEWAYDAATERVFETIGAATPPGQRATICADWIYEPTLNAYRLLRKSSRIAPVERGATADCTFLVMNTRYAFVGLDHQHLLAGKRTEAQFRDARSGTVLLRVR